MKVGKKIEKGDGDALDICVFSERAISHSDIILQAIPIGGFRMIDKGEADDKIIAVMKGDELYQSWKDISDCPQGMINRLKHYFLTYKNIPGAEVPTCEITHTYGAAEACEVIQKSMLDYKNKYLVNQ